jgi:hypothetical protein
MNIFISYSLSDAERAGTLRELLKSKATQFGATRPQSNLAKIGTKKSPMRLPKVTRLLLY